MLPHRLQQAFLNFKSLKRISLRFKSYFANKTKPLVGIDISNNSVKLLQLSRVGNRYQVEAYAIVPLATTAVMENEIKDSDVVAEAITQAMIQSQVTTRNVVTALEDASVISKVIQMDASLKEHEIEAQIRFEADQHIPFELAEVNFDFQILGRPASSPQWADIRLTVSRSKNIASYAKTFALAGLNLKIIDLESYAIARACKLMDQHLPNNGVDKIIAVIDIDDLKNTLTVLNNFDPVFSRSDLLDGNQLEKISSHQDGYSNSKEKKANLSVGIVEAYEPEVLKAFAKLLVQHVQRHLQFFFSSSGCREIHHVVLAGASAVVPGLAELIQNDVKLPVSVANPLAKMLVSERVKTDALMQNAPSLFISCGLAMRSFAP